DFESIRDFAGVVLLFKLNDECIWNSHIFVRKGCLDNVDLKQPIKDCESRAHLAIVDETVINIRHIVNWLVEMRNHYCVNTIVADSFRFVLVKQSLGEEGFEIMYVRTKGIEALLAPRVETIFAEKRVVYDDNPLMRWYTNNVKV